MASQTAPEIPGVDEYVEELQASKDNRPMKWHRVCGLCHPEAMGTDCVLGTPAVCGEKVLGLPARMDSPGCEKCKAVWARHAMNHIYNGSSSRG